MVARTSCQSSSSVPVESTDQWVEKDQLLRLPGSLFCGCLLLFLMMVSPIHADSMFVRGNVNGDASANLADAVAMLEYSFSSGSLNCFDAADVNDDGSINLADPIYLLNYLFVGGPPPVAPFPECGADCTADALDCDGPTSCPSQIPAPILDPHSQFTNTSTITLGGQAPLADTVVAGTLAGSVTVPVVGGIFLAEDIPLQENTVNNVYFTASLCNVDSAPTQLMIIQDVSPPQVSTQVPAEGAEILTTTTEVLGTVSDLLSGAQTITVTVDGIDASVNEGLGTTGTFLALGIPLGIGVNTIEVVATDFLGNSVSQLRTVTRIVPSPGTPTLQLVSGNAQIGSVGTMLSRPIAVQCLRGDGSPFDNKLVDFTVTRNNGWLNEDGGPTGTQELALFTDSQGVATARWGLGSTAGEATDRVVVSSTDVAGELTFCASGLVGAASQINIGDGNNQYVQVGNPAPLPLRIWVSEGINGVEGAGVNYFVVQGGGTINGQSEFPFSTMSTGHAEANFMAGPEPGLNIVEVSLGANPDQIATFYIYGIQNDPTDPTTFIGVVQSNASQPIEGAQISLELGGSIFDVLTDPEGKYEFFDLPVSGPGRITIDGGTATASGGVPIPAGTFPFVAYPVVVIPNAENKLPQPILLPHLDPLNEVSFDGSQDVQLTVEGVEGLEIQVPSTTAITLADGTTVATGSGNSVTLSLNRVNHDDVPMPIPDGAAPPFAWTLQPAGAHFDPPLPIQYPNISGLEPGSIAYFLSYNHQNNRFEIVCSGTVSLDGSMINSDPGVGLPIAGWGCNCPPYSLVGNCCEFEPIPDGCSFSPNPGSPSGEGYSADCFYLRSSAAGVPNPDPPIPFCFTESCNQHDLCYAMCFTTTGLPCQHAEYCDYQLFQDNLASCDDLLSDIDTSFYWGYCKSAAFIWYHRLHVGGNWGPQYFNFAQETACICEPDYIPCTPFLPPSGPDPDDPDYPDEDGDFLPDEWEIEVGLDPDDGTDGFLDIDGDELNAYQEFLAVTDPFNWDSDGNGLSDADDFYASQPPVPEVLDSSWQVTVNGRTVEVLRGGGYKIPNISATDQFGPGGPGTTPDFESDEMFRVIGVKVEGLSTRYAWSEPFRVTQGQLIDPLPLTISSSPPPFLYETISLEAPRVIEFGTTGQCTVTGIVSGGGVDIDITSAEETTYRTSNASVLSVDASGVLTPLLGDAQYSAVISVTNNGTTVTRVVRTAPAQPLTTVLGYAYLSVGTPLAAVDVSLVGLGLATTSDATGYFEFTDVLVTGPIELIATVTIGADTLVATATIADPEVGGISDVGILNLSAGPTFRATSSTGSVGATTDVDVIFDTDIELRGWSFGLCHDNAQLQLTDAAPAPLIDSIQGGEPAEFVSVEMWPDGVAMGVLIDFQGESTLLPGAGYWLLEVDYQPLVAGVVSELCFCDTLGTPANPVQTVVVDLDNIPISANTSCGSVTILP